MGRLPPPAASSLWRETRIIVPSLVQEFDGAVRRTAPSQCRDGVDDPAEAHFRFRDLVKGLSQGLLGSFTLDRDAGDVACRLDQLKVSTVRSLWLPIGHCERT